MLSNQKNKESLINNKNQLSLEMQVDDKTNILKINMKIYIVVLDCNFGARNYLEKNNYFIFGQIRNGMQDDRVPFHTDLDRARELAKRMVAQVISDGTTLNKKYPVLGAVVLGIFLRNVTVQNVEVEKFDSSRNYSNVNVDSDIVLYNIEDHKNGVVKKSSLASGIVVDGTYVMEVNVPENIAFYLHNINPTLTYDDISMLKKMYDANKNGHTVNFTVDNDLEKNQTGGDYYQRSVVSKNLYMYKKKLYDIK